MPHRHCALHLLAAFAAASARPTAALMVTEYVGMAPSHAFPDSDTPQLLKWAELTYDPASSRAAAVQLRLLNTTSPAIGKWFGLDFTVGGGGGAALTAKILGDKLYVYIDKRPAPQNSPGLGCCADTMRVYDRQTGVAKEWDIDVILDSVFPENSTFHKATHTFDVREEGGVVYIYMMVQHSAMTLGAEVFVNAVVAFSTATGLVRTTVDGDKYFSFEEKLGTRSTTASDTVYKVQYYHGGATTGRRLEEGGGGAVEQWHGNGLLLFQVKDGTKLLAFTHRLGKEAVVLRDPYTYRAGGGASGGGGGGEILQRFGTPAFGQLDLTHNDTAAEYHAFGVPAGTPVFTGGVHNLFFTEATQTASLRGHETLSLFVNSVESGVTSFAYEFAVKLVPQRPGVQPTDAAFSTASVHAACNFQAVAEGGARAIGDGVFIVADGLSFPTGGMLAAVDVQGGAAVSLPYPTGATEQHVSLYDPFIRVVAAKGDGTGV